MSYLTNDFQDPSINSKIIKLVILIWVNRFLARVENTDFGGNEQARIWETVPEITLRLPPFDIIFLTVARTVELKSLYHDHKIRFDSFFKS